MTKQTVLRKMLPVVLMLLGTTAIAQESGKLPVISGQINTNQRTVSQQPPSKAQLVVQPPNGHVANKDAAPLIAVADVLVNNNSGAGTTSGFTQSETSVIAFGNNVVIGFNDAGSFGGVNNKFTGWSYSSDGGATFTDGGSLPTNAVGDAGDPVLARNNTTGRIYLLTLGFNSPYLIQVFHSDNNGITWSLPTSATPGGNDEDKAWITVDNFAGGGNGNVYLLSRRFGGAVAQRGIYFFSSTDNGATFSPTGGSLIASGASGNVQGAYLAVGPDHSLHAIWYDDVTNDLKARRSTDFGATWSAPVTIVTGLAGGTNGDLGLTGIRQGTAVASGFRTSKFPHAAINPVNGNIYVTYANDPAGADKADVSYVRSTDNGLTWGAPIKINDDITTTDQWQPTVAVSPDGLHIGFFYYSRQEDAANNNLFKYYGRTGTISGSTVTLDPSFAVSSVASFPEFGRDTYVNNVYMGDYNTAVATNTEFNVVWGDNRDDLAGGSPRKDPNVYFKKVSIAVVDNEPPKITCPADITTSNDAELCTKTVNVGTPTASDNSGTVTISGVRSDALALSAPYPVGTTTILWKATDPSGNFATCTQTIIINDTELPNAKCKNVTVTLVNGSATITAAMVNNGSTDNCGIQSVSVSKTTFNCSNVGANTVTLKVTDIHSNVKTCTATVTVVGEGATCSITSIPENNIYTGGVPTNIYLGYGPQSTTLQVSVPASGAPYTYSWSGGTLSNYNTANPVFAPTTAGTYVFSVLVTNKYGCTSTCTITIHVYDVQVPGKNGKKVYLCHAPPGNPDNAHTLEISVDAVADHLLSHPGDHLGSCDLVIARSNVVSGVITQVPVEEVAIKVMPNAIVRNLLPYPNPSKGSFDLLLDNYKTGSAEIRILNQTGSVIEKRNVMLNSKGQILHFDLKNPSAGIYSIQIKTLDGIKVSKIMINR